MSLTVALNTAVQSLLVIQTQTAVASSNIANADVAGYTRKSVDVATQTAGGAARGVTDNGIVASSNAYLLKSIAVASSEAGYAETYSGYFEALDQAFGRISGTESNGTSLASALSDLESAITELATTPESETLQAQAVSDLDEATAALREASGTIQDLRTQADQEIATTVDTINALLHGIDDLNDLILQTKAAGQSTADLEDARTAAVQDLAGHIDISYFTAEDGALKVYTGSGQALLDGAVHELSHAAVSAMSSSTAYQAGGGTIDGITVNGVDITGAIGSGTLKALIEQRDQVLPDAQAELDTLAAALIDSFNAAYNKGTSDPAPASLTGTVETAAGDAFSGSGTVRIAVVGADGSVGDYADIDLSGFGTVSDVLGALNAVPGVAASIDAEGHLVLAATDPDSGVAINEMTSAVGPGDEGFSSYFGLNDLLTGTSAATIAVRDDILADPGLFATGALDASATLASGDPAVGSGATAVADALAAALADPQDFPASGSLGATAKTLAGYAGAIVSGVAAGASTASSATESASGTLSTLQSSYSAQYGVNLDEETARLTQLESAYSATAQIISAIQSMFDSLMQAVAS